MKILAAFFQYDYGDKTRGESLERNSIVPSLGTYCEVVPFWLEDHGYPAEKRRLQVELLKQAEETDPDFILFVLMRDEIDTDTLVSLGKHWKTANWFVDDLWRFDNFSSKMALFFSHIITIDKYSVPGYSKLGCKNVFHTQWGSIHEQLEVQPSTFAYGVSFVGSWTCVRGWYVQVLRDAGISVDCFGSGWSRGRVQFQEMRIIAQSSKISLNLSNSQPSDVNFLIYLAQQLFLRLFGLGTSQGTYFSSLLNVLRGISNYIRSPKRVETIKARNFEIPASGGFQLSYFCIGIEEYFSPGHEIALFSAPWELAKLTKYYLDQETERERIRMAGNRRASEYTYDRRFKDLVEWLKHESR